MLVYDYLTLELMSNSKNKKIFKESFQLQLHIVNKLNLSIEDFYNLPFTPELITKFFKGWKTYDNEDGYEYCTYFNLVGQEIDFGEYYDEGSFTINDNIYPMPIVLNDFLVMCKLEKIELELK